MTAPYARIVADIRQRIESGELPPGARVPSTRQLIADYGVAMATASKALAALRQAGLVHPVPGVGTVVAGARRGAAESVARQRKPPRTDTDDVVRAAIVLADSDGLGGLSMRRIATELGMATMSVYRHVANRDELVARMIDSALGTQPLPADPPDGWRARAELSARQMWAACQRHPWLAHALSMTRPQVAPNGMAHTEFLLAALDGYDLDLDTRMHVAITVFMFVRGVAVNIEPELRAIQDSGMSDEDWMTSQKPSMQVVADVSRFPNLSRAMNDEIDMTLDSLFEFGLRSILDGLDTFLHQRSRPSTSD
ncbi:MAG TPA: TetR/AcrR family transcriptional regulator C-terminal domain-containing protein [Actinocatenispora sp.]